MAGMERHTERQRQAVAGAGEIVAGQRARGTKEEGTPPLLPHEHQALQAHRAAFFSDPVPKTPRGARSTVGFSTLFPKLDLANHQQFGQAVMNVVNLHDVVHKAAKENRDVREVYDRGKHWYDIVNESVQHSMAGASGTQQERLERGAGMTAAVSAGLDWKGKNIHAISEMHAMRDEDWNVVHRHLRGEVPRGAVVHMLHESSKRAGLGPSDMSTVTSENLARAQSIMTGEKHPLQVFDPRTSPKEHHFWKNIVYPQTQTGTTGDFRAHDIAAGERVPADYTGRGISSAGLPPTKAGKPRLTRYDLLGRSYEAASEMRDIPLSHQMQGITWEGGKWIEKAGTQKGDVRYGAPYTVPHRTPSGQTIHLPYFTRQGRHVQG